MDLRTVSKNAIKDIRYSLNHRDGQSFDDFVEMLFERYNEHIYSIDDGCTIKDRIIEEVEFVEQRIFVAYCIGKDDR